MWGEEFSSTYSVLHYMEFGNLLYIYIYIYIYYFYPDKRIYCGMINYAHLFS